MSTPHIIKGEREVVPGSVQLWFLFSTDWRFSCRCLQLDRMYPGQQINSSFKTVVSHLLNEFLRVG